MPIEPLVIDQVAGMALSDEERTTPYASDYARNVIFRPGDGMITPLKAPLDSGLGVSPASVLAPLPDGKLLAIFNSHKGSDQITRSSVPYLIDPGGQYMTLLDPVKPYPGARPSYAFIQRTLRIARDRSYRPIWYNPEAIGLSEAALLKPDVTALAQQVVEGNYTTQISVKVTELSVAYKVYGYVRRVKLIGSYSNNFTYSLLNLATNSIVTLQINTPLPPGYFNYASYTVTSVVVTGTPTSGSFSMTIESIATTNETLSTYTYSAGNELNGTLKLNVTVQAGETKRFGSVSYYFAWEYDGYQEGPLSDPYTVLINSQAEVEAVDVTLSPVTPPSPRITGIVVYRAYVEGVTQAPEIPEPVFVKRLEVSEVTAGVSFRDELAIEGPTYSDRTGLPSTLPSLDIRYELIAASSTYAFYGLVTIYDGATVLGVYDTHIFRSKELRPDMVDWTADFVVLPEKPVAMHLLGGRLMVWTAGRLLMFDEDLRLLEELPGLGIVDIRHVAAVGQAVVWFSGGALWFYDGATLLNVGRGIEQAASPLAAEGVMIEAADDVALGTASDVRLAVVPAKGLVYVFVKGYITAGKLRGWVWDMVTRSFSVLELTDFDTLPHHFALGSDGRGWILGSKGSTWKLMALGEGASLPYLWRSVDIARGVRTRIYEVVIHLASGQTAPFFRVYYENNSGKLERYSLAWIGSGQEWRDRFGAPVEGRRIYLELEGSASIHNLTVRQRKLGR